MGLIEAFEHPGTEYRSYPFWAWNEKMDKEEVIRQIRQMKAAGMGGFFIHSRDGLETEYMGREWMDCVKAAVDTAKECGMYAWLYDEDRWPSGTAGGRVTALGDAYRLKGLTLEVCGPEALEACRKDSDKVKALYAAVVHDMDIESLRRLPLVCENGISREPNAEPERAKGGQEVRPGEVLLAVRLEVSAGDEWFNNQAPPDNLNPDTVKCFLELTHQKYKDLAGGEFGKTVPGIFTDEPSLADRHAAFDLHRGWIPWSYGMDTYFKERRGYDFFDILPYQYFNGKWSRKARHDYWRTIAERYCEAYSQTIGQWCEKAGLAYTGHFLQEDKMGLCTRVNGSIMPHYAAQGVPGIDMLTERTVEYMTVKQCTSVAHQFGKQRALTETYGCTGWDFDFEGQKWVGDWQYVLGINMRCTHMALSSLRGCRKRDYPPSFNYNTTWWDKNHVVEDYFARLGAVLSKGEPIRDILLLHPMSTAWSRLGTNPYGNPVRRNERDVPEVDEYGYRFNRLIERLCREHMDCDLGDEILMQQNGWTRDGRIGIEKASYSTVVVPRMDTLFETTRQLLISHLKQGGRVVMTAPLPFLIEGAEDAQGRLRELYSHPKLMVVQDEDELIGTLESLGCRSCRLMGRDGTEEKNLLVQLRRLEEGILLFAVNNNREEACAADVLLPFEGEVQEWDPLTGKTQVVVGGGAGLVNRDAGFQNGFHATWEKAGSRLYFIRKTPKETAREELPHSCEIRTDHENVLTLDMCRYQLEQETVSDTMEIWQAQCRVREALGMAQIHRNGLMQRYCWVGAPHPGDGKRLKLYLDFVVEEAAKGDVYLVLEQPFRFEISCNEEPVSNAPSGWFLDKSFERIKLPGLKTGVNTIVLSCAYANDMELENCYLVGNFGVTADRALTAMPKTLAVGDWTKQGLYHYSGSVTYRYHYQWNSTGKAGAYLQLGRREAVCVTVMVNGKCFEIPWSLGEPVEITDALEGGDNLIEIQVMGSPRNMMGPLHLKGGKPLNTHDSCFSPDLEEYTAEYQIIPYGLMEPAVIVTME